MAKNLTECFFVTPIGDLDSEQRTRANAVQKHVLTPIARNFLNITRADEVDDPGTITTDIVQRLYTNPLVIADLTGQNPNVMYEVGLRHCFNLPIVHIAQSGEKPPFDLASERIIFFDIKNLDSVEEAKRRILSACKSALNAKPFRSPVVRALERETLFASLSGSPAISDIADRLESMETTLENTVQEAIQASYEVASEISSSQMNIATDWNSERLAEFLSAFDLVGPEDVKNLARAAKELAIQNRERRKQ